MTETEINPRFIMMSRVNDKISTRGCRRLSTSSELDSFHLSTMMGGLHNSYVSGLATSVLSDAYGGISRSTVCGTGLGISSDRNI